MLANTPLTAFLTVPDANTARTFYRDTLGLPLVHEDNFALVFHAHGVQLRISIFPDFHPQPFTVLGWQVEDADAMSRKLQKAGILFERFPGLTQDELGLWLSPGGYRIGWFRDPFGNLLSISQPPATPSANPSS
jgi:catechol 2,3-dioxygenase-like lactoylglutathione lyase family enzyme